MLSGGFLCTIKSSQELPQDKILFQTKWLQKPCCVLCVLSALKTILSEKKTHLSCHFCFHRFLLYLTGWKTTKIQNQSINKWINREERKRSKSQNCKGHNTVKPLKPGHKKRALTQRGMHWIPRWGHGCELLPSPWQWWATVWQTTSACPWGSRELYNPCHSFESWREGNKAS